MNIYLYLSCYNSETYTSPFYKKNINTGCGNMLFQIASILPICIENKAKLNIIGLQTYLDQENLILKKTIFRNLDPSIKYNQSRFFINDKEFKCKNFKVIDNIAFQGYFEDYKNFEHIKPIIIEYFSPSIDEIEYLRNKYVINDQVCSLHIRGNEILKLCSKSEIDNIKRQYNIGINHMINNKNIKKFIVMTDDKIFSKSLIEEYKNIEFIFSNERDFYDIWLISIIKNNITSQSTLSWWGSYLNQNKDKYIIYIDCEFKSWGKPLLNYPEWISILKC